MNSFTSKNLILFNAKTLRNEINWFKQVRECRLNAYYNNERQEYDSIEEIPVPIMDICDSPYAALVLEQNLSPRERLILILTLLPMLEPDALDPFLAVNINTNKVFSEFGAKTNEGNSGFIPTLETAIFILGGKNQAKRLETAELFSPRHQWPIQKLIEIKEGRAENPISGGVLAIKKNSYSLLIEGHPYLPRFGSKFPAIKLETRLKWRDLILKEHTAYEVEKILNWLIHYEKMKDWKLSKRLNLGYKVLFYGPSGTGKTLTANLLGNKMNKEVYRVDLAMVVSKYVGETEKNLANLFDQAEDKEWILFFDEADSLFGKRVNASNSNDQHANMQTNYLLQRIESYSGVVILSTNSRNNLDSAFSRRFHSIIHFTAPDYEIRLKLWQAILPKEMPLAENIDIKLIAKKYQVTGAMIVNIVQDAVIASLAENFSTISEGHLIDAIQSELAKIGR